MELADLVNGSKKADLNEMKEMKVKVRVGLLVKLHYMKLTQSRAISAVVNEALTEYFANLGGPKPAPRASFDVVRLPPGLARYAGQLYTTPPPETNAPASATDEGIAGNEPTAPSWMDRTSANHPRGGRLDGAHVADGGALGTR